ncbi:MAG: tRNA lysidine(34) synthetase TilS [Mycolicibacterium sp.]|uniref:tRNA(Ile)-lysidine synthase n=1 Tax=Mycolicibacterium insubricum TaxID=444597 RepID=A0A1X0CT54_9MYCO|nr:tRNA lysidine(34) synthetase TilS [Mycolicibacterium insubricum]MCB9439041.1 tRNA lysidine(34) synthetase TilS [Mycolicibacterium sp.]ORA63285.1 tRNA lysidine(34) synthetase TilS [Mycolicibacterium insubricum]
MDRPGAVVGRAVAAFADRYLPGGAGSEMSWCVALSGGADSLALTAAAAHLRPTTALIVDHRLQPGSADIAARAAETARALGCVDVRILPVDVGTDGGPEAAARTARYAALDSARQGLPVLIGHTLDDQAETVLLGLGRGSGPRSIAGMVPHDPPWCRPLLGVRRAETLTACADAGLTPWADPHNDDPRYTRVRLRTEVLPLLEDVLGGGVAESLARTAIALQEDNAVLDAQATALLPVAMTDDGLDVGVLGTTAPAVRRRVLRLWLLNAGSAGLTDTALRAVDALIGDWHGQGGVAVAGTRARHRMMVERRDGALRLRHRPV